MDINRVIQGDCLEELKKLEDNSIDSVVTDPPYGINFMGKKWDYDVPSVEVWTEVMRVLKPGGHMLCACGTRTQHRMAVNIEDAGFEIRDIISWLYGSGFPKSHNIGKSVDKLQGNEREVVGEKRTPDGKTYSERRPNGDITGYKGNGTQKKENTQGIETKGSSPYEGWGTALKPAQELFTLCRKPLSEKTVAKNVLKWGTGGINIDECRVEYKSEQDKQSTNTKQEINNTGRFPANLILECICDETLEIEDKIQKNTSYKEEKQSDGWGVKKCNTEEVKSKAQIHTNPDCPCYMLDEQSGITSQGHWAKTKVKGFGEFGGGSSEYKGVGRKAQDKGGASRFFYCAKASKSERNEGLEEFEDKEIRGGGGRVKDGYTEEQKDMKQAASAYGALKAKKANIHPTVKPIKLMEYLIKLITPTGGTVLDPYIGSGSTGVAAKRLGFNCIGIEREPDYVRIAEARINSVKYKLI